MYFPMYIEMKERKVLVAGGGKIAERRIKMMFGFGADITVVAPQISPAIRKLCEKNKETQNGRIKMIFREYRKEDIKDKDIVLAVTDSPDVNRTICADCREKKIPVNVADDHRLCDFYFPSVVVSHDAVIGICSGGKDPRRTKQLRKKIEEKFGISGCGLYEEK